MTQPDHPRATSARRARKPWYRTRNLAAAILLIIAAWLGKQIHWALTAQPTRNHTYGPKLQALIASHRPAHWPTDGEDATQLLATFGALRAQVDDEFTVRYESFTEAEDDAFRDFGYPGRLRYDALYDPDAPPIARREAITALDRMDELGANTLLDRIAATRTWHREWPTDTSAIDARLPYLGTARNAARYATARFVYACETGNEPEALRAYEHALVFTAHTGHNNTLLDRLVAIAIMNLITQELMYQLADRRFSAETLAEFQRLTHELGHLPPPSYPIETERISVVDSLELFFAPNGRMLYAEFDNLFNSWNGAANAPTHDIANLAGVVMPTRDETEPILTDFYDRLIEAVQAPPLERENAIALLDLSEVMKNPVGKVMIPALTSFIRRDTDALVRLAVMDAILAIEQHAQRTGGLPNALDDIAPNLFAAGRPPTNPETDEPFAYVLLSPGESPHNDPRRYLLTIGKPLSGESPRNIAYNKRRPDPEPEDE